MGEGHFLSGGSGEESTATLTQVVGRIQFPAAVGLRLPLLCWLLAGGLLSS